NQCPLLIKRSTWQQFFCEPHFHHQLSEICAAPYAPARDRHSLFFPSTPSPDGKAASGCREPPCRRSGDPPRLGREGKRKLTESSREFPKASARPSPEGSLREARERSAAYAALPVNFTIFCAASHKSLATSSFRSASPKHLRP